MSKQSPCPVRIAIWTATMIMLGGGILQADWDRVNLPDGTVVQGSYGYLGWNSTTVYDMESRNKYSAPLWVAPRGTTIVSGTRKSNDPDICFFLLSDGSIYKTVRLSASLVGWTVPEYVGRITSASPSPSKIYGDALYVIDGPRIHISRNEGKTWQIDTTGLLNADPWDVFVDAAQNAYLATDKGLFKQDHEQSGWKLVPSMTKSLQMIFVDRKDRFIYVGVSSEGLYKSTNNGTSWERDTSGLGNQRIDKLRDDVFGNIYTIGDFGQSLYRSTSGSQPWTRVDKPITDPIRAQLPSYRLVHLAAESLLVLSTDFGFFSSSNQGASWQTLPYGLPEPTAFGYRRLPTGREILTTGAGIHFRNSATSAWTRAHPQSGRTLFYSLHRDKNGILYTSNSSAIFKSIDQGSSWTQDTPGFGSLPVVPGLIYVDENGTQHYASPQIYQTFSANVYIKSGASWVADENGITQTTGDRIYGFASDGQGNLFLIRTASSNVNVLRRPLAGGTWVSDTNGLSGAKLHCITKDRTGAIVAGGENGTLFRRVNGAWTRIPTPSIHSSNTITSLSVDSSGTILAAFEANPAPFRFVGKGVYFSKDNGTGWTSAGLDSVRIRSLESFGDSTFALTLDRGITLLRTSPVPFLQLGTQILTFADVSVGQRKDLSININNSGTDLLSISNISTDNPLFAPQAASLTLSPNQNAALMVRFTPSAPGPSSASIVITSNSTSSPDTIVVMGGGIIPSGVESMEGIPTEFSLSQNYPNPFNPTTTIRYGVPDEARVKLHIYDLLGRRVKSLVDEKQTPGFYQVAWQAGDLPTGIYFYQLQAGAFVQTKKLILLK